MSESCEDSKISQNSKEMSLNIKSPIVMYIIKNIKAIQKRMKDPDVVNLSYIEVYDLMTKEFTYFSDNYTRIFTMVIRGDNLATIASILYYWDKVDKGLMSMEELSDNLATKFLPQHLKEEADARIKELNLNSEIRQ